MHRTKRMARNLAWQDTKNPFARRSFRRAADPQDAAETGKGSALFRPSTDDPANYPQHNTDSVAQQWDQREGSRQHAATVPASSRRRPNEPGDRIGELTLVETPASVEENPIYSEPAYKEKSVEILNGNDKASSDQSHEHEKSEKHGLRGWLQGTATDKKEKAKSDDNNGKTKPEKKFTPMSQLKATLFNSWINLLLIASPVGIAVFYANVSPIAVFVINFIAIIPLAALLSYATEEIALRTGEVIGGLLNASFGNAVELIVTIIALVDRQILIVQTSLIGSMLSNLLLVLGMCFFAGGVNRMEQAFNMTVAQTAASLLFLAVSSLLIPTAFNEWANTGQTDKTSAAPLVPGEVALSRATAILLLIVYACYLFFQLKSHSKMYNLASEKNEKRDFTKQKRKAARFLPGKMRRRSLETASNRSSDAESNNCEEEREEPQLSIWVAGALLAASTALVALNAEYLVDSIDAITCGGGISKNFVGLILLPIVGNAAEHATAVTVAIKDKMDLAIGVAVGSSMQIALLVLPLAVVLGWIIGRDMTLYFDGFQIAVLFVAVLLVNYLIQDGKSHWLEGVLLMILYVIIAVAAWFYPTAPGLSDCPA